MIAVVGLGNPGKEYEKTVHNLGFMSVDNFASKCGLKFTKTKYFGKVAEGMVCGEKIVILKPETYMNLSGKSVENLVHTLKLDLKNLIVVYDDIDLSFADLRVRAKGSAGTHNGMRDIVQKIGEDFARIRVGAGRPEFGDLANYVLSKLSDDKLKTLAPTFDKVSNCIEYFIKNKTVEGLDINRI